MKSQQEKTEIHKNNLPENPGGRLVWARKHKRLTQEELGGGIGMTQGHISDLENNRSPIKKYMADAVEYRFGINSRWLLTGEGEPLKVDAGSMLREESATFERPAGMSDDALERKMRLLMRNMLDQEKRFDKVVKADGLGGDMVVNVPLHMDIAAGDPRVTMSEPERWISIHPSLLPKGVDPDRVVAAIVYGNSMAEKILNGAIVFIDTTPRSPNYFVNHICAVKVGDAEEENTVKRLYYQDNVMVLAPSNPSYPPKFLRETDDAPLGDRIIGWVFGVYNDLTKDRRDDDLKDW